MRARSVLRSSPRISAARFDRLPSNESAQLPGQYSHAQPHSGFFWRSLNPYGVFAKGADFKMVIAIQIEKHAF
jgi:hypothetical protein